MLQKLPFKLATNSMLFMLSMIVGFHFLILTQIIPYDIVWGGRLQNIGQMRVFELVSISVNAFIIMVIALKAKYLKWNVSVKVLNVFLWLFVVLFSLNTLGNLFAETTTETIIFTPLTFISAILCCRIAIEY